MKRRDLLRHLSQHGCQFLREGAEHSIWENPLTHRRALIPRHRDIPAFTVARICKQMAIPAPSSGLA